MRQFLIVSLLAMGAVGAGCKSLEVSGDGGKRIGVPPPPPVPGKALQTICTDSGCDLIPVNMHVAEPVGGTRVCTAKFLFQRVVVQTAQPVFFGLSVSSPQYQYRFTNPTNAPVPADPAGQLPGIDINYLNQSPAFTADYPDGRDVTRYAVTAVRGVSDPKAFYPFKIHTEWSSDGGTTWLPCTEIDPVIVNDL